MVPVLLALVSLVATPFLATGQEIVPETVVTARAEVVRILDLRSETIPGTEINRTLQTVAVRFLEGPEKGAERVLENVFFDLAVGDVVYINHVTSNLDGSDYYAPAERDRSKALGALTVIFVGMVIVFGGIQGIRGLAALFGSFFFIGSLLLPGILHGYSPILVSIGVSSVIIILGSYVTHGFTRTTSAAVIGMIGTITVTGFFAYGAIEWTQLSGATGEETTYLNLNTRGTLDLAGILLGGILIGLLGVLYDAAIGQAVSVEELIRAAPQYSRRDVYRRALRIGREHVGALVNTLAIAYAGASLPLLLLFYGSDEIDFLLTINRELFASEIVRILIGSTGLVLAVPITTAVAVYMLMPPRWRMRSGL